VVAQHFDQGPAVFGFDAMGNPVYGYADGGAGNTGIALMREVRGVEGWIVAAAPPTTTAATLTAATLVPSRNSRRDTSGVNLLSGMLLVILLQNRVRGKPVAAIGTHLYCQS